MAPLAFVYDRCASRSPRPKRELEMRTMGCHAYADGMGWVLAGGGPWLDSGPDALTHHRPRLAAMLDLMREEAARREVVCLLHNWDRLATDHTHRLVLQQRIIEAGGWSATTFGESDRHSVRAVLVGRQP